MVSPLDSAHFDPKCIPNKIIHRYPHLSKDLDLPKDDKSLKTYKVLAAQHQTHTKVLFLTEQSTTFVLKKQYRVTSQTELFPLFIQTSGKFYENINSKIEPIDNGKSTEFHKNVRPQ